MLCETKEQAVNLINNCRKAKVFAFDIESSGLSPSEDDCLGLGLACGIDEGFIPMEHAQLKMNVMPELNELFASGTTGIAHRAYFDLSFLMYRGLNVRNTIYDTKAFAFLLDETQRTGLKSLVKEHCGIPPFDLATRTCGCCGKSMTVHADIYDLAYYCMHDCIQTYILFNLLADDCLREFPVAHGVWQDLILSIAEVSLTPVELNREYVNYLYIKGDKEKERAEKEFYVLVNALLQERGIDKPYAFFNINSPEDIGYVLYDLLDMPVPRMTKSGRPSVDVIAMIKVASMEADYGITGFTDALIKYRKINKVLTTYLTPYLGKDSLQTRYDIYTAKTGRFTAQNPNLQNVPESMRAAMIAGKGNSFVIADYCQLELCILAHLTGEPEMVDGYNRGDFDLHAEVAKALKIPRKIAKGVNFGVAYGRSEWGLASGVGISVPEARQYIKRYFERFTKIAEWRDVQHLAARKKGYVTTILGRKRRFPDWDSVSFKEKKHLERVAVNSPIQGSAADVANMALLELRKKFPGSFRLQCHDEFVLEVPDNQALEVANEMASIMKQIGEELNLVVPLKADVRVAKAWAKKKVRYYKRSDRQVDEHKRISDVPGSGKGGEASGEQITINDVLDIECLVKDIRGPFEGQYGDYYFIDVEIKGDTKSFITSHQVVLDKVLNCKNQGELPVYAKFIKNPDKRYFDVV